MKFYEEFEDRRDDFEILAFHDDKAQSFAQLDTALAPIRKQVWGGKELPFPILLDHTGTTLRELGIDSFPTTIVLDPEGKLVKQGGEGTVRHHLMKTSKPVQAHLRELAAAAGQRTKWRKVVEKIGSAGGDDDAFAIKTFVEESGEPWHATAAAEALRALGGQWATGYFLGKFGLQSDKPVDRVAAAGALADLGDEKLLFTLQHTLSKEQDESVRQALQETLRRLSSR
jgi:HEAT repeat protein